jgi:hypothetical protein
MTRDMNDMRSGIRSGRFPKRLTACLAFTLMGGAAAAAPAAAPGANAANPDPIKICTTDPKADCIMQPGPSTPIGAVFKPSYDAYLAMKAKAHGGTHHTATDMPDWRGIWVRVGKPVFDVNQPGDISEGRVSAQLTPHGEQSFRKLLSDTAAGNEYDPISDCLPAGFPRLLASLFQWEFVDTPGQTWWLYEQQAETRRIYTDGRGHVPDDEAYPLWDGDSIGFWDGDTLVVHTINVRPTYYQRSQPYYSDQTSTLERIRKSGPNQMEDDVTVWDPLNLAKPWHVVQHWRRITNADTRIDMWSCSENANVAKTATGATQLLLPGEPGFRDPNTLTPNR